MAGQVPSSLEPTLKHSTGRPHVQRPYVPTTADGDRITTRLNGIRGIEQIPIADPAFPSIVSVLLEMVTSGVKFGPETIAAAITMGRARSKAPKPEPKPPKPEPTPPSPRFVDAPGGWVYYIRRSSVIKIGTTTKLRARMRELMPDEVLALEPGSYQRENEMHQRFDHLRYGNTEYFRPAPDLLAHIEAVTAEHGAPQGGLPSLASLEELTDRDLPGKH